MARSITSTTSVIMITIPGLYDTPQQLQGFAAEDVFDTDDVEPAEVKMGVDGRQSAGFVYVATKQNFSLQADSDSNDIFENWYAAQQIAQDIYYANGLILLATGKKYTMSRGVLTGYKPTPDAKKTLQPRKFSITWESALPANV